ncbi:hypothetical protein [Demequina salsinemoris]|uniref:hypothetical protein n=1 Tax=Demequina salsinemoris TaxID=577470 RepID=UPI000780B78E|nr:hypothetical protein [Demequina salsinemoris]
MGVLTVAALVLIGYGLATRRYDRALALAGVTAAGAAAVVGSVAVPTFYAVASGLLVVLLARYARGRSAGRRISIMAVPGAGLFLAFFAWAVLVTLVAPMLFPGLVTVTPSGAELVAGHLTVSNIAQILYLGLSIGVVLLFAYTSSTGPQTLGLMLAVAMLLSLWRYLGLHAGVPFPYGVFDNSPGFAYIETAAGGIPRFRGIFSEPSALAGVALTAAVYSLARAVQVRGPWRLGNLVVAGIAIFLGIVSTSTTFVVVGAIMLGLAVVVVVGGFVSGRTGWPLGGVYVFLAMVVASVWVVPAAYEFVQAVLTEKVASDSYGERSGADADSYQVFLDTFGFGVGLGSGRASSFFATLLSTTGYVGVLLFAASVASVALPAVRIRAAQPVLWVLATTLIARFVSGPELTSTSGVMWMTLGVLASMVMADREARASTESSALPPPPAPDDPDSRVPTSARSSPGAGRSAASSAAPAVTVSED